MVIVVMMMKMMMPRDGRETKRRHSEHNEEREVGDKHQLQYPDNYHGNDKLGYIGLEL